MKRIWQSVRAYLRMRTRYTRALEDEVARLQAENRALVNSILGVAGLPPMRVAPAATANRPHPGGFAGARLASAALLSESREAPAPLRRRSWQQIGRALELEDAHAAQRERETNGEIFPVPRGVVPRI